MSYSIPYILSIITTSLDTIYDKWFFTVFDLIVNFVFQGTETRPILFITTLAFFFNISLSRINLITSSVSHGAFLFLTRFFLRGAC